MYVLALSDKLQYTHTIRYKAKKLMEAPSPRASINQHKN